MSTSETIRKATQGGKGHEVIDKLEEGFPPLIASIFEKYPEADVMKATLIILALQSIGCGRNKSTADSLRAIADTIESDLPAAETVEAMIDGKLQ
jgi:hypothetical protein